mmetsp:Transcript_12545/g.23149  ORF Transcript_12545/g.23149 Transcript_12545/m.23149 type:complete len:481 (-) Transcript_12545:164-1606(-)
MPFSFACHCSCSDEGQDPSLCGLGKPQLPSIASIAAKETQASNYHSQVDGDQGPDVPHAVSSKQPAELQQSERPQEFEQFFDDNGCLSYTVGRCVAMHGEPIRTGMVLSLIAGNSNRPLNPTDFQPCELSVHVNGLSLKYMNFSQVPLVAGLSPFTIVHACRLHNAESDERTPWIRLFKVYIFSHDFVFFFATQGADAHTQRARWVADIARSVRLLTRSLFPPFAYSADPLENVPSTSSRLLAGYLLLCDLGGLGASVVFCELHSHKDGAAAFRVYENEACQQQVMSFLLTYHSIICERVGVDCSCISIEGHHFSARTCQEKLLWLRAISNIKMKLRNMADDIPPEELIHYREAVREGIAALRTESKLKQEPPAPQFTGPLLPRRRPLRLIVSPSNKLLEDVAQEGPGSSHLLQHNSTQPSMHLVGDDMPALAAIHASLNSEVEAEPMPEPLSPAQGCLSPVSLPHSRTNSRAHAIVWDV